jgi:hypothetical protein
LIFITKNCWKLKLACSLLEQAWIQLRKAIGLAKPKKITVALAPGASISAGWRTPRSGQKKDGHPLN